MLIEMLGIPAFLWSDKTRLSRVERGSSVSEWGGTLPGCRMAPGGEVRVDLFKCHSLKLLFVGPGSF